MLQLLVSDFFKAVPDAANGFDKARCVHGIPKFTAQGRHVDIHDTFRARKVQTPDAFQQPCPGPGKSSVLRHGGKQFKLQFGEVEPFARQSRFPAANIYQELTRAQDVLDACAAEQHPDTGRHFTRFWQLNLSEAGVAQQVA